MNVNPLSIVLLAAHVFDFLGSTPAERQAQNDELSSGGYHPIIQGLMNRLLVNSGHVEIDAPAPVLREIAGEIASEHDLNGDTFVSFRELLMSDSVLASEVQEIADREGIDLDDGDSTGGGDEDNVIRGTVQMGFLEATIDQFASADGGIVSSRDLIDAARSMGRDAGEDGGANDFGSNLNEAVADTIVSLADALGTWGHEVVFHKDSTHLFYSTGATAGEVDYIQHGEGGRIETAESHVWATREYFEEFGEEGGFAVVGGSLLTHENLMRARDHYVANNPPQEA